VNRAVFDFVVPTNVLSGGNSVNWDVLINGNTVGSFTVAQGQTGAVHLDFTFSAIAGPNYTVRFEVTNEVPGGAGSHTLGYAGAHAGTVQLSGPGAGATTAVVETYADIEDSVCDILDGIPHAYDFYDTHDLSTIDFSPYDIIILGMDGGQTDQADMAHVATYVNAGAKLIIVGGSSLAPFAQGLNDNFIQIDMGNHSWSQVAGAPDLTVVDAGHPLASGLPGTYNFVDSRATYYMARITDVGVRVLAENGDGHPCYVCKPIGAGEVIYFINSAYDNYWADAGDYAILDTILQNAIEHSCGPPCETTWDVYLGTNPGNMQLVCQDVEDPCCDPGGLSYGTNYFWRVVAKR
jgi:hypothetical protein